jgi:hypothetical protein
LVERAPLFNSSNGSVYLIPYTNKGEFLLSQIGYGGDLGVFSGVYDLNVDIGATDPEILFRIQYGQVSPRKHKWVNLGMAPYKGGLRRPYPYIHRSIGSDECYLVTYGEEDRSISCNEVSDYEPLATWSHEHIVDRFRAEHTRRHMIRGGDI